MAAEVSHKLTEIMKLCSDKNIRVTITQYGSKRNSIERTIEMGEDVVMIQLGDENDENVVDLLNDFIKTLTG